MAVEFFVEFGLLLDFSPVGEFHVRLLFITQSYERIDAHGAACWDVARCYRDDREQHGYRGEMQRIGGAHAIKQAAEIAGKGECRGKSDRYADERERQAFPDNQLE